MRFASLIEFHFLDHQRAGSFSPHRRWNEDRGERWLGRQGLRTTPAQISGSYQLCDRARCQWVELKGDAPELSGVSKADGR